MFSGHDLDAIHYLCDEPLIVKLHIFNDMLSWVLIDNKIEVSVIFKGAAKI